MRDDATRVVLVTAPNLETGEFLARELVEERLAACGNVLSDLVSLYWWEGEVQRDDEVLILFKTRADRLEALERRVLDLHPYEVPEVLALPVGFVHRPYAEWVAEESDPEREAEE